MLQTLAINNKGCHRSEEPVGGARDYPCSCYITLCRRVIIMAVINLQRVFVYVDTDVWCFFTAILLGVLAELYLYEKGLSTY